MTVLIVYVIVLQYV